MHCFCVCSGSALLGDLLGVSRSREHNLLSVLSIYSRIFLCVFIGYHLLIRFLFRFKRVQFNDEIQLYWHLSLFCTFQPLYIMDGKYRLNVEEKRQQGVGPPVRGSPRGSYRGYPSSRGSAGRGGWRGRGRGMRSYGPGRSSDDDNSGDEPLSH